MDIYSNLHMLIGQIISIFDSRYNALIIIAVTSQIASMFTKVIIEAIKTKKLSFKTMSQYGGMPSSHTVFIMSFVFGMALDKRFGWKDPLLSFSIVVSAIVLIDTVRFRGTLDKLNKIVQEHLPAKNIKFPKFIAHTSAEVIGGVIFAFIYTFLFYLFFYNLFV